jgi:hypothetical protein
MTLCGTAKASRSGVSTMAAAESETPGPESIDFETATFPTKPTA